MDAGPAAITLIAGGLVVGVAVAVTAAAYRARRARRRETFRLIALDLREVQNHPHTLPTPRQPADTNPPSVGRRHRVVGVECPEPSAPTTNQAVTA